MSFRLVKGEELAEANPQVQSDLELYGRESVALREREERFAEVVAQFSVLVEEDQRMNDELMALDDKVMKLAGIFIGRLKR